MAGQGASILYLYSSKVFADVEIENNQATTWPFINLWQRATKMEMSLQTRRKRCDKQWQFSLGTKSFALTGLTFSFFSSLLPTAILHFSHKHDNSAHTRH
jgi:hypothetical protein